MTKIDKEEIPIIFVFNFCINEVFEDKLKYQKNKNNCAHNRNKYLNLLKDINHQLSEDEEQTQFINKEKIPVNCLSKRGFKDLFEVIYTKFEDKIINEEILTLLEKGTFYASPQKGLKNLLENNYFFKNIKFEDIISNQMKSSVLLINTLILKLTGQYSGTLIPQFKFKFTRLWNYIRQKTGFRRPNTEFYPLLTDLVSDIYKIFGEEKSEEDCNEFIKERITKYFKIDSNDNISFQDFQKDIVNYRNLFYNTKDNFELKEDTQKNILEKNVFEINDQQFSNIFNIFIRTRKEIL